MEVARSIVGLVEGAEGAGARPFLLIGSAGAAVKHATTKEGVKVLACWPVAGHAVEEWAECLVDHIAEVNQLLPGGLAVVAVACAPNLVPVLSTVLTGRDAEESGGHIAALATIPGWQVQWLHGTANDATPPTATVPKGAPRSRGGGSAGAAAGGKTAAAVDDAVLLGGMCVVEGALPELVEVVRVVDGTAGAVYATAVARMRARCGRAVVREAATGRLDITVPSTVGSADGGWVDAECGAGADGGFRRHRPRGSRTVVLRLAAGAPIVGVGQTPAAALAAAKDDVARAVADSTEEWGRQEGHGGALPNGAAVAHATLPQRVPVDVLLVGTGNAGSFPYQPRLAHVPRWHGYGTPRQVQRQYRDVFDGAVLCKCTLTPGGSGNNTTAAAGLVVTPAVLLAVMTAVVAVVLAVV